MVNINHDELQLISLFLYIRCCCVLCNYGALESAENDKLKQELKDMKEKMRNIHEQVETINSLQEANKKLKEDRENKQERCRQDQELRENKMLKLREECSEEPDDLRQRIL